MYHLPAALRALLLATGQFEKSRRASPVAPNSLCATLLQMQKLVPAESCRGVPADLIKGAADGRSQQLILLADVLMRLGEQILACNSAHIST